MIQMESELEREHIRKRYRTESLQRHHTNQQKRQSIGSPRPRPTYAQVLEGGSFRERSRSKNTLYSKGKSKRRCGGGYKGQLYEREGKPEGEKKVCYLKRRWYY